jgi:hypothetical protein
MVFILGENRWRGPAAPIWEDQAPSPTNAIPFSRRVPVDSGSADLPTGSPTFSAVVGIHDQEGWTPCEGSVSAVDTNLGLKIADLPTEKARPSAACIRMPW